MKNGFHKLKTTGRPRSELEKEAAKRRSLWPWTLVGRRLLRTSRCRSLVPGFKLFGAFHCSYPCGSFQWLPNRFGLRTRRSWSESCSAFPFTFLLAVCHRLVSMNESWRYCQYSHLAWSAVQTACSCRTCTSWISTTAPPKLPNSLGSCCRRNFIKASPTDFFSLITQQGQGKQSYLIPYTPCWPSYCFIHCGGVT